MKLSKPRIEYVYGEGRRISFDTGSVNCVQILHKVLEEDITAENDTQQLAITYNSRFAHIYYLSVYSYRRNDEAK